jgi:general secretion pathway protein G
MPLTDPDTRRRRRGARGFTLLELLVVLVLLGIIGAIVAPQFLGKAGDAKRKAAKLEIDQIGQALDLYKLETGRYPTTQEGLQALVQPMSGVNNWAGPYLKKGVVPKDPWGNEYLYASPGDQGRPYEIVSYAGDGREGGEGEAKDVRSSD